MYMWDMNIVQVVSVHDVHVGYWKVELVHHVHVRYEHCTGIVSVHDVHVGY